MNNLKLKFLELVLVMVPAWNTKIGNNQKNIDHTSMGFRISICQAHKTWSLRMKTCMLTNFYSVWKFRNDRSPFIEQKHVPCAVAKVSYFGLGNLITI